jgi:acetoin utilization deacetylase AcuC-like enzyme
MATAFYYHEDFLLHDAGAFHPERPERLKAILHGLKKHLWKDLIQKRPEPALEEEILTVHSRKHFEDIRECARIGAVQIDMDTRVSAKSFDAAMLAAGAAVQAVSAIMDGEFDNAFAAVRPPGHHATTSRAMGFCLFNNIAIAARHLTRKYSLRRVLIVDWDVHHGNGTQEIFYDDPSVVYISLHKKHHYPGTGWENEKGSGDAAGTKINYPIGSPFNAESYEGTFTEALGRARSFAPEFILISCGFDAHERDPLGNLALKSETYGRLTGLVRNFAAEFGHQRIFSILEGGYDERALAESAAAHVGKLMEK